VKKNNNLKSLCKVTLLITSALLAGCVTERDEEPNQEPTVVDTKLSVQFNWSGVDVTTKPASMSLALFVDGAQPVQSAFQGNSGGTVSVLPNTYKLIAFNDDTESLFTRGDSWDEFEIYAQPTTLSNYTRMFSSTRSIPYARGTEDQTVVLQPNELWTSAVGSTAVVSDKTNQVSMSMQSATVKHQFKVNNVQNLEYVKEVVATISGMSGSWFPAGRKASTSSCIVPFQMSSDGTSLKGEVCSFGVSQKSESDSEAEKNMLTIYAEMKDGSKVYYVSDVTKMVTESEKSETPVVIEELPLPLPVTEGGGMQLSVDKWTEIFIEIPMN